MSADNKDEVLDFIVQSRRNAKSIFKLIRKNEEETGVKPTQITIGKPRSYHAAFRTLCLLAEYIDSKQVNNPAGKPSSSIVRQAEQIKKVAELRSLIFCTSVRILIQAGYSMEAMYEFKSLPSGYEPLK